MGGLDMAGLRCPTHSPVGGDERVPVLVEELDKLGQQGTGLGQLEAQRLTQGQVVIKGVTEWAHASPPGHGKASARKVA